MMLAVPFSIWPGGLRSCTNTDANLERKGSDKCGGILTDSLLTTAARVLAAGDYLRTTSKPRLFQIFIKGGSSVPQDVFRDRFGPSSTDFAVFKHARQG
jgi:hypothetical protein